MYSRMKALKLACVSAAAVIASVCLIDGVAEAQKYPERPVRMVVPTAAGGTLLNDISRAYAKAMAKELGQNVLVDNRPGGAAVVGTNFVARAPADGHTLLFITSAITVLPWTMKDLPFDPGKDFTPVSLVARGEWVLYTHPSLPAKNLAEFIQHAKANPGKLNVYVTGDAGKLVYQQFMNETGIKLNMVVYQGTPQAVADLLAGRLDAALTSENNGLQYVQTGMLKALAVTGSERSPRLPDVPTFAEAGLPKFNPAAWFMLLARSGTPAATLNRLSETMNKVMKDKEFVKKMDVFAMRPVPMTLKEVDQFFREDFNLQKQLVDQAGMSPK